MRVIPVGLIVLLAFGFLMAPLAAEAQWPAKVLRIGALCPGPLGPCRTGAFERGLRELGYVDGQNIVIEWRVRDETPEQARELAVELVQLPVDVIVAGGAVGALAAKQATSTTPIVFLGVGDPVASGLVASLAHPGGNVTGVMNIVAEFHGKRLQLLLEAVPGVTRVAALRYCPPEALPPFVAELQAVEEAARSLGVHLHVVEVEVADELEGAFAAMTREGAQALFMFFSPFFTTHRTRVLELAAKSRLPGIYESRVYVEAGGLMSYNASLDGRYRRAAWYVDRILKGTKPAELPVEQPMHFELVINLKTAKALGLTIPPIILIQATEVIP